MVIFCVNRRMKSLNSENERTSSPNNELIFFHLEHFVNLLQFPKKLIVSVICKIRHRIALFIQLALMAQMTVREQDRFVLYGTALHSKLYSGRNLKSFLALASEAIDYALLEQQIRKWFNQFTKSPMSKKRISLELVRTDRRIVCHVAFVDMIDEEDSK